MVGNRMNARNYAKSTTSWTRWSCSRPARSLERPSPLTVPGAQSPVPLMLVGSRERRRPAWAAVLAALALAMAPVATRAQANGSDDHTAQGGTSTDPATDATDQRPMAGTIVVSAASSLTEAFEELAADFERAHPGVRVELNFGGSSTLATQVLNGAPVDVFASADREQMVRVSGAGLVAGVPQVLAANALVAITPTRSDLTQVADLAAPGVRLVLAGPEVPAGRYARAWLESLDPVIGNGFAARVMTNLVSEETNVRQVAAKVELGEADAAIVYATDARVLTGVRVLAADGIPGMRTEYVVAALETSTSTQLGIANEFVAFLLSPRGEEALRARGFEAP